MSKESWKELTIGTINRDTGSSKRNLTGSWRSGKKPEFIEENCIHCFFCWLYCPHSAILIAEEQVKGIDYDYCTGCGLCSEECPSKEKSIIMVKEEIQLFKKREK